MKQIVLISFMLLFAATISAQKKPHCKSTTKKVMTYFEKKKYVEVNQLFSSSLQKTVSAEQLGQIWESVCKKGGGFVSFGEITETTYRSRPVNQVECQLKNEKQQMIINYTVDGEICGLFFQPISTQN